MAELISLKNIGKELDAKLKSVGIETAEQLIGMGAAKAYVRLKMAYPEVCAVHLYALEGAICGVDFDELTKERKDTLLEFASSLDYLKNRLDI